MKLNRKGYLTVEVILASVAAVAIAFFLMEITIKLVNVTDDAFVDTELLTDKALIIENIKENLEKDIASLGGISEIGKFTQNNKSGYIVSFCYSGNQDDNRDIFISKDTQSLEYTLEYTNDIYNGGSNNIIYTKKINNSLYNISITSSKTGSIGKEYIGFKVTADNKFSKEPFEANIIVYNNKTC